jgi:hypothetical protein
MGSLADWIQLRKEKSFELEDMSTESPKTKKQQEKRLKK